MVRLDENYDVVESGLPKNLTKLSDEALKELGWYPVHGHPIPQEQPAPGYQWVYGAAWNFDKDKVKGTWKQEQQPQPYPSWLWEEGVGWTAPVEKPEGDFTWDEETQTWVEQEAELV